MTDEDGAQIADEIRNALRRLTIATVAVYVVLAATVGGVILVSIHSNNQIRSLASSTNAALCTLRSSLEQQVNSTQKFLVTHPDGFGGIPKAAIEQSLASQQATIEALGDLEC